MKYYCDLTLWRLQKGNCFVEHQHQTAIIMLRIQKQCWPFGWECGVLKTRHIFEGEIIKRIQMILIIIITKIVSAMPSNKFQVYYDNVN